eukprot:CAMPEP_0116847856 /NCGR_PEP_ID=MMETSP0418-20121206/14665_1 /TAXON_ID=1158023 /ORGANISM="Astrosyne radiata, Strain 13vi08-1A" /LENGTH=122 /DNA_ID=CAMNT_0004479345 /DNA_START=42 /DNA_END=410 /DNA_ORIENTATION=+
MMVTLRNVNYSKGEDRKNASFQDFLKKQEESLVHPRLLQTSAPQHREVTDERRTMLWESLWQEISPAVPLYHHLQQQQHGGDDDQQQENAMWNHLRDEIRSPLSLRNVMEEHGKASRHQWYY